MSRARFWWRSKKDERASAIGRQQPAAVVRSVFVVLVLAACGGLEGLPAASTDAEDWLRCEGDKWSVQYPADWVVHPADPARGLATCALFAREAFETEPEEDRGWSGAQVVLGIEPGCRGSFEVSTSEEQLEIEGFPAWRRSLREGHGDDGPATAYEYVINLSPRAECEEGRWFYGRTEADDPGDFQENRTVLDKMIATLSLRGAE